VHNVSLLLKGKKKETIWPQKKKVLEFNFEKIVSNLKRIQLK